MYTDESALIWKYGDKFGNVCWKMKSYLHVCEQIGDDRDIRGSFPSVSMIVDVSWRFVCPLAVWRKRSDSDRLLRACVT